jgi:Flp pilus assembly pilin Flp
MVEYALILVLVSVVVIVILLTMGNQIANVFSNVVALLSHPCNPGPGGGQC